MSVEPRYTDDHAKAGLDFQFPAIETWRNQFPGYEIEIDDPELTSEVEVRFVPEGPDRTRVELEHRHLDRHGPGWQSVSDGVDSDQGWPLYLARYTAMLDAR